MRSAPLAAVAIATFLSYAASPAPAAAARILIIGDSHTVGPFGSTLDEELRRQGHDVDVQAVCGASGVWWLGPERFDLRICYYVHGYGGQAKAQNGKPGVAPPFAKDLLATEPDVVVFALGSNPDGNTAADTGAAAEKLLALTPPSAKCFWVGPPPMPKRLAPIGAVYNELPQAFSRVGRSCTLIDSRLLIKPEDASPNDHFYGEPAKAWGKAVARRIAAAAGPTVP